MYKHSRRLQALHISLKFGELKEDVLHQQIKVVTLMVKPL